MCSFYVVKLELAALEICAKIVPLLTYRTHGRLGVLNSLIARARLKFLSLSEGGGNDGKALF